MPSVRGESWPKDPLDNFILAELEASGLKPAPLADKRTFIRRVSFDLTGLPPTPAEIDDFLEDESENSFESVVDRLLDSSHFGERWGRHWLDVARYADSNGLEFNLPYNNAWRYRDYVVDSFNNDKPFDEFIREQLAGDLLPWKTDEERFENLTATGFLVLGPKALFEPNQDKLAMDVADEQIDVTTRAFLGLTVSCARCHDHKFDPIPTRDYYALAGIFKSTATLSNAAQQGPNPNTTRWMERPLATREKANEIEKHVSVSNQMLELLRKIRDNPGGIRSAKLPGIVVDNISAHLTGRWKESIGSTNYVDANYIHDANSEKGEMAARFVPTLPHTGGYEVLVSYTPFPTRATNVPVTIHALDEERKVFVNQRLKTEFHKAFVSLGTYSFEAGTNGWAEISNAETKGWVTVDAVQFVPIDEWKLELEMMANRKVEMAMAPETSGSKTPLESNSPMVSQTLTLARDYFQLRDRYWSHLGKAPPPAPMAMAVQEGTIGNSRINIRGDVENLGSEVPRGFPTILKRNEDHQRDISKLKNSGRLELANWIADHQNPLTARVAVNRIWLRLVGRGLVDTPDNFGRLVEQPVHFKLLDYLAGEFVQGNWSFKKLIRTIVLSSTYQMSSGHNAKAYALDPDNRYVWKMNRRRLEAEALRDAILKVSGKLDLTLGGTVLPSGAAPVNNPLNNFQEISSDRRSVYLPVIRNNVTELFRVFDFVDPHTIAGKRHTTTAATQALFLLNSDFMLEQSRAWAKHLLDSGHSNEPNLVSTAYTQAFGRDATQEEINRILRFLREFRLEADGQNGNSDQDPLLAWQALCQAILASTEFQFLD